MEIGIGFARSSAFVAEFTSMAMDLSRASSAPEERLPVAQRFSAEKVDHSMKSRRDD